MEQSHIEKFREFWKSLSSGEQHRLWDVLAALRGPDIDGCNIVKENTTARIRYALCGDFYYEVGGHFKKQRIHKSDEKEYYKELKRLKKKAPHFLRHVFDAVSALSGLYDIKNDIVELFNKGMN